MDWSFLVGHSEQVISWVEWRLMGFPALKKWLVKWSLKYLSLHGGCAWVSSLICKIRALGFMLSKVPSSFLLCGLAVELFSALHATGRCGGLRACGVLVLRGHHRRHLQPWEPRNKWQSTRQLCTAPNIQLLKGAPTLSLSMKTLTHTCQLFSPLEFLGFKRYKD